MEVEVHDRIGKLIEDTVKSAVSSELSVEQAIACFGFAAQVLLESTALGAGIDPHVSFAKGLAALGSAQPAAVCH